MATFTSAQTTDLAEILGTNSNILGGWLTDRVLYISDEDKTRILERVTAYRLIETNAVSIEPNMRNFGARLDADNQRSLIRKSIAGLLYWQESSGRLQRS